MPTRHGIFAGTLTQRVGIGERVSMMVAYSEAAMDANIAGTRQTCELHLDAKRTTYAKVVPANGSPWGIFTPGELGFLRDDDGYYCYPDGI